MDLTDDDIVNLVNLKFLYRHHDYSVYEIMAMRDIGKNFIRINSQVHAVKAEMIQKQEAQLAEKESTAYKGLEAR
jgi:hypothetical protein